MTQAIQDAEAAVRAGEPARALEFLTEAVKARPADPKLRIFLSQLFCVLGRWDRAHTQLNVVADMDASTQPMREMVGHALRCEIVRAAVFEGRRPPMVFGQPQPWLAKLIESLLQAGRGEQALSASLAEAAFEEAPAAGGRLDGQPFQWIADADSRLGPVLEAMVNGRYYWIPFQNLARITIEPPTDLRDSVWLPAELQFANGGAAVAMIPVRYPGSERSEDGRVQMSRTTVWQDAGAGRWTGMGQRVLVTDAGEHDLLSIRSIEIDGVAQDSEPGHG
jgi:type VI secretion system protein ImpE